MNWANYLLQVNLYLILFYGFYFIFLKNETFFQLNRIYLLGSAVVSMLIPVFYVDWIKNLFLAQEIQQGWKSGYYVVQQSMTTSLIEEKHWVLGDYLILIYLTGILIFTFRFFFNLFNVAKIIRSEKVKGAFSFFRKIKVDDSLPQYEVIMAHEKVHVTQMHSIDVLFFELLKIFNWFNPVCYFYKKSMTHIHEFIADHQVIASGKNKKEYAFLIFNESFSGSPHKLTNTFFNKSLLKRRILMLQKEKSKKVAILKYGLSVPLFLVALIMSSATISDNKTIKNIAVEITPQQTLDTLLSPQKIVKQIEKITVKDKDTTRKDTLKIAYNYKIIADSVATADRVIVNGDNKSFVTIINYDKNTTAAELADIINKNKKIGSIEVIKYQSKNIHESGTKILNIEVEPAYTVITFEHPGSVGAWIQVNQSMYLQDANGESKYNFIKAENIPLRPERYVFKDNKPLVFKLYFEKLKEGTKSINIIERALSEEQARGNVKYFNYFGVNVEKPNSN